MHAETRYARRMSSHVLHIVTGVPVRTDATPATVAAWYPGMTLTAECGQRSCFVLEEVAVRGRLLATTCKRCRKTLGW